MSLQLFKHMLSEITHQYAFACLLHVNTAAMMEMSCLKVCRPVQCCALAYTSCSPSTLHFAKWKCILAEFLMDRRAITHYEAGISQ